MQGVTLMTFISVMMASSLLMYLLFAPEREEEELDHDDWVVKSD